MNLNRILCKEFILKLIRNIAIVALFVALVPVSSFAGKKVRKLPMGAYIKSAKIDILSGDLERYKSAIAMLDSLFMFYGPTAEAIQLRGSMEVDYIDKAVNMDEKMQHVKTLVAYIDTLHMTCDKDNKDVKKKYKKNCDKLIIKNDSLIVKYWREFYNNGINMMNDNIDSKQEEIVQEIANGTDSSVISQLKDILQADVDTIVGNFELCIALDETNVKSYVGLGALFEKLKDYEKAVSWLEKGLDKTDNKVTILQTISYDYIKMGDYASAIPYMREYVELAPDDVLTMGNLAICYNSQKMFDSSFAVNKRVLAIDSVNIDALSSVGHYFRQLFMNANDSSRAYREAGDDASTTKWEKIKNAYIDSSLTYYKRVLDVDPKNEQIQFLFATYNYFKSNWKLAIKGFKAAAEINPNEADYWRSLGDAYIQTKEFDKSAAAYEKVVVIDPNDKVIWDQLVSLYSELRKPKDKARAEKHLKALE